MKMNLLGLDIDFLDQNFLVDILEELNKQLGKRNANEFDKKKIKIKLDKTSLALYY